MAKILDMPKLSPTMEEGVLSTWHKKEGDDIAVDDLLAEVETDKATMEFRSFDKSTLLKILVAPGAQVKLGQPVAIIGSAGEDISAILTKAGAAAPTTPAEKPAGAPPATVQAQSATPPPPETVAPPAQRKPPVGSLLDRTAFAPEPAGNGARVGGGGHLPRFRWVLRPPSGRRRWPSPKCGPFRPCERRSPGA
ncbi:MAG: biotin/lipoyl-containing protein [Polyangiaceae bacterium]